MSGATWFNADVTSGELAVFKPSLFLTPLFVLLLTLTAAAQPRVEVVEMGTLPEKLDPRALRFSQEGGSVAFGRTTQQGAQWVVNGQPEKFYPGLLDNFSFGAGGARYAYGAMFHQEHGVAVVDGREEGNYYQADDFAFSPDGEHVAYEILVGQPGGWYHDINIDGEAAGVRCTGVMHPIYSPDSEHLAFVRLYFDRQTIVRDGKEGPPYSVVLDKQPLYSPDSQHLAYGAVSPEGGPTLYVDGEPKATTLGFSETWDIEWSPDSTRVASGMRDARGRYFWVDGEEGPRWPDATFFHWSPDGKHYGYSYKNPEGTWDLVIDGDMHRLGWLEVDKRSAVVFSHDSQHWAVAGREGGGWYLFTDGEKHRLGKIARGTLQFDPDGRGVYAAKSGKGFSMFRGKEEVLKGLQEVHHAAFAPDGRLVTVAKRDDQWHVFVDGESAGQIDPPLNTYMNLKPDGRGGLVQWTISPERVLKRVTVPAADAE